MTHRTPIRVRYNECDPQGIVFNANYLVFADVACNELWREELGGYDAFLATGHDVVVGEANVRFLSPARFDEELEVLSTVDRLGTSSIVLRFAMAVEDRPVAEVVLRYVCVAAGEHRSAPVPDALRAALERHLTPEAAAAS
jgi:acyl-CoA thioester hydrolase